MSTPSIRIYHNTRCSKSREVLDLLKDYTTKIEVFEYLKTPPDYNTLKDLLMKLNLKPKDIIRTKEPLYKAKFENKKFNDEEWIQILVENPALIERPIVVKGNRAIVARPPELVHNLF